VTAPPGDDDASRAVLAALSGLCGASVAARAQQSDACKTCRDFQQACLKAHSAAACNTDYAICMKHCRKK
jgi:hypothetical protein